MVHCLHSGAVLRGVLLIGLLCAAGPTYALDPARRVSQLQMTRWDRKQGLPSNNIDCLAQTSDGYLWIGTSLGLLRFDGRRFTQYHKSQYPGLPTEDIHSLVALGETLFIGTSNGMARLEHGAITTVPGVPAEWISHLLLDGSGQLWLTTHTGVYRKEGDQFLSVMTPAGKRLPGSTLAPATDGSIWIHANGQELWRWKEGTLEEVSHGRFFTSLRGDPDGSMWAVGEDILVHFDHGREETVSLPRDQHVSLVRDDAGSLWTASGLGLTRRTAARALQTLPIAALGSMPVQLLLDREGNLWVATDGSGLVRLRDSEVVSWSVEEGLPSRVVMSFFQGEADGVWVTTENGVARVTGDEIDAPLGALARPIVSLHARAGQIWIGSGDGLTLRQGHQDHRILDALAIMMAERDDGVWIASQMGLLHFRDGKQIASYGMKQGAPNQAFLSLLLARDGSVWAGSQVGLCRLREPTFHCFSAAEGGPTGYVEFIHQDTDGDIWIGTNEDGLYRVHEEKFTRFTTEQGLPTNTHYAVLEDDRGQLWTSSAIGISRIDKASLLAGAAKVRLYDERQGMRSSDCLGGGRTGLRDREGKLWFATGEGAVVIDPSRPDPAPPMLATRIEERTQDERGWLTIRYAAPSLAFGEAVSFRHQLGGFDNDWVTATDPLASYTNVPPGQYRFLAQARVGAGAFGPIAEMVITVPARWWQTGLFRAAAVTALGLLLLALYRLRTAALLRQKRRLEAVVDARTQELEQANATLEERVERAVTSLREAERMAAYGTMVAGVAHEVRQPMFALGTTAYVLSQKLADRADVAPQLALVTRETKRVNAIMDELLAFARPAELSKRRVAALAVLREAVDSFRAEHDPDGTLAVSIEDTAARTALLDEARVVQVLVNLMGNAKKHAAGITRIRLVTAETPGRLSITVDNDGGGITAEHLPHVFEPFYGAGAGKGSGLGLAIVRRLVELHGGEVRVASDEQGTRFTLELPTEQS